jgi:acyl-coenzyme A synthetase/AMP-(fatty) acid ligase
MKIRTVASRYIGESECDFDFLLSPPDPRTEFIVEKCSYEKIYRLAAGIKGLNLSSGNDRGLACLCTDNKTLIAASIIASLAGGPLLVLPYMFSRQIIEEVCNVLSPTVLLADRLSGLPRGYSVFTPSMLYSISTSFERLIDLDDPFLMLFTGGSTGKPRVWVKTLRNLLGEAWFLSKKFGIDRNDIFLSTVPPQHIYGLLFSILIPLVCSSSVIEGIFSFPREIVRAAQQHKATILVGVPPCYRVMKINDLKRYNLRMAFSSAGTLREEDAKYFHDKTGLKIIDIYGSTETVGVATRSYPIYDESWTPLDPVEWKITDGRLLVRSPFLSPGLPRCDEGFFITADSATYEGHRKFILHGRVDGVIKIGGKKVDLTVVKNKLKQIRGVRDAVVVSFLTENGHQNEMSALVVTDLNMSELRHQMAMISESYAIPKRIVAVNKIPITSTGKYNSQEIDLILQSSKT